MFKCQKKDIGGVFYNCKSKHTNILYYYIHTEIYPLKRRKINFRSQAGLSS